MATGPSRPPQQTLPHPFRVTLQENTEPTTGAAATLPAGPQQTTPWSTDHVTLAPHTPSGAMRRPLSAMNGAFDVPSPKAKCQRFTGASLPADAAAQSTELIQCVPLPGFPHVMPYSNQFLQLDADRFVATQDHALVVYQKDHNMMWQPMTGAKLTVMGCFERARILFALSPQQFVVTYGGGVRLFVWTEDRDRPGTFVHSEPITNAYCNSSTVGGNIQPIPNTNAFIMGLIEPWDLTLWSPRADDPYAFFPTKLPQPSAASLANVFCVLQWSVLGNGDIAAVTKNRLVVLKRLSTSTSGATSADPVVGEHRYSRCASAEIFNHRTSHLSPETIVPLQDNGFVIVESTDKVAVWTNTQKGYHCHRIGPRSVLRTAGGDDSLRQCRDIVALSGGRFVAYAVDDVARGGPALGGSLPCDFTVWIPAADGSSDYRAIPLSMEDFPGQRVIKIVEINERNFVIVGNKGYVYVHHDPSEGVAVCTVHMLFPLVQFQSRAGYPEELECNVLTLPNGTVIVGSNQNHWFAINHIRLRAISASVETWCAHQPYDVARLCGFFERHREHIPEFISCLLTTCATNREALQAIFAASHIFGNRHLTELTITQLYRHHGQIPDAIADIRWLLDHAAVTDHDRLELLKRLQLHHCLTHDETRQLVICAMRAQAWDAIVALVPADADPDAGAEAGAQRPAQLSDALRTLSEIPVLLFDATVRAEVAKSIAMPGATAQLIAAAYQIWKAESDAAHQPQAMLPPFVRFFLQPDLEKYMCNITGLAGAPDLAHFLVTFFDACMVGWGCFSDVNMTRHLSAGEVAECTICLTSIVGLGKGVPVFRLQPRCTDTVCMTCLPQALPGIKAGIWEANGKCPNKCCTLTQHQLMQVGMTAQEAFSLVSTRVITAVKSFAGQQSCPTPGCIGLNTAPPAPANADCIVFDCAMCNQAYSIPWLRTLDMPTMRALACDMGPLSAPNGEGHRRPCYYCGSAAAVKDDACASIGMCPEPGCKKPGNFVTGIPSGHQVYRSPLLSDGQTVLAADGQPAFVPFATYIPCAGDLLRAGYFAGYAPGPNQEAAVQACYLRREEFLADLEKRQRESPPITQLARQQPPAANVDTGAAATATADQSGVPMLPAP